MKIQQNIGILNALLRITCGLTILAWSTAKLVKFPWRDSYLVMAFLGAMKVGEGIVRFCPITALFEKGMENSSSTKQKKRHDNGSNNGDLNVEEIMDQMLPYNPT